MFEFRFKNITEDQLEKLEEIEIYPIEENFKEDCGFIVYGEKNMENILINMDIQFIKNDIAETGWEDTWKEFLKPGILAGDIYYIFDDEVYNYKKTVKILPALAFGTGTHPTTRVAADLLISVCNSKNVIDVGCGSGILALAAEISGAKSIIAIDVDSVALGNTLNNIRWNNSSSIYAWAGGIESVSPRFSADIVCANIITSVLLAIRDEILSRDAKYIVLSGIMRTEYDEFIEKFMTDNYIIDGKTEIGEWCGVRLKKVKI